MSLCLQFIFYALWEMYSTLSAIEWLRTSIPCSCIFTFPLPLCIPGQWIIEDVIRIIWKNSQAAKGINCYDATVHAIHHWECFSVIVSTPVSGFHESAAQYIYGVFRWRCVLYVWVWVWVRILLAYCLCAHVSKFYFFAYSLSNVHRQ